MGQGAAQATQHIGDQVAEVPQAIFYVVAEDEQEPHVGENVAPGSVQKHGSKERHNGHGRRCLAGYPLVHAVGTNPKLATKLASAGGDSVAWNKNTRRLNAMRK